MQIKNPGTLFTASIILLILTAWVPAGLAADTYTLLYVSDTGFDKNAHRGARQGLQESNHQAAFMNIEFKLEPVMPGDYDPSMADNAIAVLVAADSRTVQEVVESTPDVAVINLIASDDSLREACYSNAFHIIPSDSMFADAEAQWLQKNPDSHARAYAWHKTFARYAARDLNKRFHQQIGKNEKWMIDETWTGWAGVKIVTESVLRLQSGNPQELLSYLQSDLFFDGQKGYEMTFREDGQLRQIVLLVEDEKVVGEAPVRGVVEDESDLDTLGQTAECK
jgi:ABC-type branched-subunit amino acid transport system substrate-binding protein